jgi:ribosome-associated protein
MGLVATGGEAKYLIQGGYVEVNGQVETRRKRQLHPGDRVTLGDRTFVVESDSQAASPPAQDIPGHVEVP